MSEMIMYRDNGSHSPNIFRVRHSDDVADEILTLKEINAYLEDAPHPKLRHWLEAHREDTSFDVMEGTQQDEFAQMLPYHEIEHAKNIHKLADLQAEYNRIREHAERVSQIVLMIGALQRGYASGEYRGPMNDYEHTKTEYPHKYRMIVAGLSPAAMANIADWEVGWNFRSVSAETASAVHERLSVDRAMLPALKAGRDEQIGLCQLRPYHADKDLETGRNN